MSDVQVSRSVLKDVYTSLDVNDDLLGCIMLDVEPFDVVSLVFNGEEDIFQHPDEENHPYTGGAPAETAAHCTLLYGLMESGKTWKPQVDTVLEGWTPPKLTISGVTSFKSRDPELDYSVIVAEIAVSYALLDGHNRLRLLPHIDTFPEYRPHITLAYIKNGPAGVDWAVNAEDKWIRTLDVWLAGRTFSVDRINYGDEH